MKTPRDILLKRHRSVEPKLDQMWTENLSTELRCERTPARENIFLAAGWKLWRELFLPSRRIWAGLACAWVLIFALNLATREEPPALAKTSSLSQDTITELRQQNLFFAELIGLPEPRKTRPPASVTPGSQSERRREFMEA